MRRAALVVAAALALAGSAPGASKPPVRTMRWLKALPVIDLGPSYRSSHTASCSARVRQAKGTVASAQRKVLPVACEQPPRSKVRDAGSVIVLAP